MRRIRDVLTYTFEQKLSHRQIAQVVGVHHSTIKDYLDRFANTPLSWPLPTELDDSALEEHLFPLSVGKENPRTTPIDFDYIHEELKIPGATLDALHLEWMETTPPEQHIGYEQFCRRYKAYKKSLRISMRRTDPYGELIYVDFSGKTIDITQHDTGEIKTAEIFVGVLGGSSYTYCEATWTQKSRDWIGAHARMLEYFGGTPRIVVPDNLKAAVTKADRFDPVINESYRAMCRYYNGIVPVPARAYRPKDKARAEAGVLLVQRWILFKLRKRKFFTLEEANREIRLLLEQLNHKPFQKLQGSRYSRWLEYEKPALKALPAIPYEFAEWGKVRASVDYHVKIDDHHYSVPYQLRGKEFEYRMTDREVELIMKGRSTALHQRSFEKEGTTTLVEHLYPAHKAVKWSEDVAFAWAAGIGPSTEAILRAQLSKVGGYFLGYRITQAMKSLEKAHGPLRLEEACAYGLAHKITKTPELRNILDKKLDRLFAGESAHSATPDIEHENIRGAEYYDRLLQTQKEL